MQSLKTYEQKWKIPLSWNKVWEIVIVSTYLPMMVFRRLGMEGLVLFYFHRGVEDVGKRGRMRFFST